MDEKEDSNKPKPKSRLSEDVIYGIAEQMFFKKPFSNKGLYEIDLTKQNPYTIFMGHCQVHLNAMMAQFAKLKRIEFSKFNGKDSIGFYRHKLSSFSDQDIKDAFSGPYWVTKKMAFGVIEYGKLRVSAVRTTNYLKKEKTVSTTDDDDVHAAKKKPIEVFSGLFLDQNMSEEEIAKNCELNIEHLQVEESADVIEANIRSLLGLDSMEVELNVENELDHIQADSIFFGSSSQSNCCAARTKKISVNLGISLIHSPISTTDFNSFFNASFGVKWRQQVHFLVNCCPSLELLAFELGIYFPAHLAPERILHHFGAVVRAARNLLEQLGEGGERLHVSVDFTATCGCREIMDYRKSVQTLTELDQSKEEREQIFKLGAPFVFEDYEKIGFSYIARSLTIVDNKTAGISGLRAHQLRFKLYERMLTARKCARMSTGGRCPPHPLHNDQADLDSSSSDSMESRSADEDDGDEEEEDCTDEEEEEDDDEEEEGEHEEQDEQKEKDEQQEQPGTSKAAQNDEPEEDDEEEEEKEEEPDKKRVRFI